MRPEETGCLGRTSKSLAQSACPPQGSRDGPSARTGGPSSLVGWPHSLTMDCFSRGRKKPALDFPGGTVDANPPVNCRGHGFNPWSGEIPHTSVQLSPGATAAEPTL